MADLESLLSRWQSAGVLDATEISRIRAFESQQTKPSGLRWQGLVALILGAILLACGVALFVSAHWDELSPAARFTLVLTMVSVFHLGGAATKSAFQRLSTTLHAVGTLSTGAAIALVGQIFNIQEHWPAAVLLWAIAAIAGWALLRDEAQLTLALLLTPAWMTCEWTDLSQGHVGQYVYLGRILVTWSVLYLTLFLSSTRKFVQGILFAAAAIAGISGVSLLIEGWSSWQSTATPLPISARIWGWLLIALLPLLLATIRRKESLLPVALSIVFGLALAWCSQPHTQTLNGRSWTVYEPTFLAHALVGAFTLFLTWWGVRLASRALVNYGMVTFAITVGWFYFSNIFDKVGRSLGLIGLGVLFLAGGWALERTRRRLISQMQTEPAQGNAQ
jgi:uncharacterized membrane protein